MVFRDSRFQLIIRLISLVLFIFAACWLFIKYDAFLAAFLLVLLAVVQVLSMVYYIEKSQRDMINLLGFIQYDDFTVTYPAKKHSGMVKQLYDEYNKVIKKFRELRTEKESNLHFFRSVLQHINIGILAFNKSGEVKTINTSALRLLGINRLDSLSKLETLHPEVCEVIFTLPSHQKSVLKLAKQTEFITVSISAVDMVIYGEELRLVSLHNIQSELEEKEMEAWQNMIRVMTHEIMNSLTPITSLAATVADEMQEWHKAENPQKVILQADTKELCQAVATIKKRSEGLLHFVEDFRNLSQIPKPKPELFSLSSFFNHLLLLMKTDLEKQATEVVIHLEPENLNLMADFHLVEQVMINLIKNAIEALSLTNHEKKIEIRAFYNDRSKIEIWVKDNGDGINEEILEKVFIPFYSTKKTGSGIGLTISKQIMRMHKGVIKLQSEKGSGTLAILIF